MKNVYIDAKAEGINARDIELEQAEIVNDLRKLARVNNTINT